MRSDATQSQTSVHTNTTAATLRHRRRSRTNRSQLKRCATQQVRKMRTQLHHGQRGNEPNARIIMQKCSRTRVLALSHTSTAPHQRWFCFTASRGRVRAFLHRCSPRGGQLPGALAALAHERERKRGPEKAAAWRPLVSGRPVAPIYIRPNTVERSEYDTRSRSVRIDSDRAGPECCAN